MKAEIITIGDEILIGQVIDTNSGWIAEQLDMIGVTTFRMLTIGDGKEEILNALREAHSNSDVIILTGGLGPTRDDKTKPALCEFFDTSLVFNEDSFENTSRVFAQRNLPMTEENRKQAFLPAKCIPLPNKIGTAWGMWFEENNKITVSLPGVPYEMKYLMEKEILPRLTERYELPYIFHKTIITQGIGESWLADKLEKWEDQLPEHVKLAYLPSPGMVRLRLSITGTQKENIENEIGEQVEKLNKIIPEYICGYDKETFQEITGRLLREKKQTLATAESCTGGYISHLITSIPGSSDYFKGSVVSYSNEVKTAVLDVSSEDLMTKGAVSREVAMQMAYGVKNKLKTDYAVAVTGIAGPGGGTEDKPVGTVWIAVASPEGVISKKFLFGKNRERNILITAITALNMLRKVLEKKEIS